jgi:hypothetical protein
VTLLDEALPRWHARERHSAPCAAPPATALGAVRAVTPDDSRLIRVLFKLRGLPVGRGEPILDGLLRIGFRIVADRPDQLVAVGVGRPWRPGERLLPVDDFASFDAPGYAKMALAFSSDGSTLATETRVRLTDEAARRRFRAYWLAVRPWSGAVRRSWLAAARRRALSPPR